MKYMHMISRDRGNAGKKNLRSCLLLPLRALFGTDSVTKTDEFLEHFLRGGGGGVRSAFFQV